MIDLSHVTVEEAIAIAAPPEVVWDLVADVPGTLAWNRETQELAWAEPDAAIAPGARFIATNQLNDWRWTVACHLTVVDRPTAFEWTVLDPATPSSSWWYRLADDDGTTIVRHGFRHGPGPSGLRMRIDEDPDHAELYIAGRSEMLAANMRHTLGCLKAAAEQR